MDKNVIKSILKKYKGAIHEFPIGVLARNVETDAGHRFVTKEWMDSIKRVAFTGKCEDLEGIGEAASFWVADNDTTNNGKFLATARVVYQHGQEIDRLSENLKGCGLTYENGNFYVSNGNIKRKLTSDYFIIKVRALACVDDSTAKEPAKSILTIIIKDGAVADETLAEDLAEGADWSDRVRVHSMSVISVERNDGGYTIQVRALACIDNSRTKEPAQGILTVTIRDETVRDESFAEGNRDWSDRVRVHSMSVISVV